MPALKIPGLIRTAAAASTVPAPRPPADPETMIVSAGLAAAAEVDRLVNVHGCVNLAGKQVTVGSPLAGQRVRLRLDGILLHVINDAGHLVRTKRCPIPPAGCARLRGARPAGPAPAPDPDGAFVDRVIGVQGTIQVTGQKVRVGRVHARKVVRVHIKETTLTVYDGQAALVVAPRRSSTSVSRFRAKHQIRPSLAAATT